MPPVWVVIIVGVVVYCCCDDVDDADDRAVVDVVVGAAAAAAAAVAVVGAGVDSTTRLGSTWTRCESMSFTADVATTAVTVDASAEEVASTASTLADAIKEMRRIQKKACGLNVAD